MRYMVDSTNINDDPASYQLVAYYCDGAFAVSEAAVRARFPTAILVPISAVGTDSGIVGDCEPGCMSAAQLVDWVLMRRAAGVDPTGYVNETYGWNPARVAFAARGVPEPHWWVADYDGLDVIPSGAIAKQDMNSAMTGGHFDRSAVVDFWPGVDNAGGDVTGNGGFSVTDSEKLDLLVEELGVPLTPGGVADGLLNATRSTLTIVQQLQKAAPPSASDVASIVQAANDAKAAAVAAQAAAVAASQALQSAANVIATAAADIKAIRAKTDKDLS